MDNYKIKVKDEAESKEAQELFFELGYSWSIHGKSFNKSVESGSYIFPQSNYFLQHGLGLSSTEITFPQLRDLVVLKRGDVSDATHTCENDFNYICIDERWHLMTTDGWFPVSVNPKALKPIQTVKAVLNNLDELREEYKDYHQDPALISVDDVWKAFWKEQEVQYSFDDDNNWKNDITSLKVEDIKSGHYQFRLKPQTIKLELEIPAPYKAKIGGRDDTSFVLNVGRHQYCYNNEEDYTKARDALEAVFDSALRGTNS